MSNQSPDSDGLSNRLSRLEKQYSQVRFAFVAALLALFSLSALSMSMAQPTQSASLSPIIQTPPFADVPLAAFRQNVRTIWSGTTLTLFGVLIGISLMFGFEAKRNARAWGWGRFAGVSLIVFIAAAFGIRWFDKQFVSLMEWILGYKPPI